ncbi:MAG: hypothetical protein R3C55_05825 [Parvularculaceae bacterium]
MALLHLQHDRRLRSACGRSHGARYGEGDRRHGGVKLPTSLAIAFRAQPYVPIEKLMIGMNGECTIPTNCGVVLSQARFLRAVEDFFAEE